MRLIFQRTTDNLNQNNKMEIKTNNKNKSIIKRMTKSNSQTHKTLKSIQNR